MIYPRLSALHTHQHLAYATVNVCHHLVNVPMELAWPEVGLGTLNSYRYPWPRFNPLSIQYFEAILKFKIQIPMFYKPTLVRYTPCNHPVVWHLLSTQMFENWDFLSSGLIQHFIIWRYNPWNVLAYIWHIFPLEKCLS